LNRQLGKYLGGFLVVFLLLFGFWAFQRWFPYTNYYQQLCCSTFKVHSSVKRSRRARPTHATLKMCLPFP